MTNLQDAEGKLADLEQKMLASVEHGGSYFGGYLMN